MHRTSERERTLGPQGHRALRPGEDSPLQYCSLTRRQGPRCPWAPLRLHFGLWGRASSPICSFSALSPSLHPHAAEPVHFNHKGKIKWGWGEIPRSLLSHINMLILSFLKKKKPLDVIILQTTLYSTCVMGPRTLDTNRAMLVYHNMYAETFLLSYYPCNVRRLLIKAFKFTHQGQSSASLPPSQARALGNSERVPSQGLQGLGEEPACCHDGRN